MTRGSMWWAGNIDFTRLWWTAKYTDDLSCTVLHVKSTDQHIRAFLCLTKTNTALPGKKKSSRQGSCHMSHRPAVATPKTVAMESIKRCKMGSNLKLFSAPEQRTPHSPARSPLPPPASTRQMGRSGWQSAWPTNHPAPARPALLLHYSSACREQQHATVIRQGQIAHHGHHAPSTEKGALLHAGRWIEGMPTVRDCFGIWVLPWTRPAAWRDSPGVTRDPSLIRPDPEALEIWGPDLTERGLHCTRYVK